MKGEEFFGQGNGLENILGDIEIGDTQDMTARKVKKLLKSADGDVDIVGKRLDVDPKLAYENFVGALDIVKNYLKEVPGMSSWGLDKKLKVKALPGDLVGLSMSDGTFLDPAMLKHPAARIAHVIAHEFTHQNDSIPAEGLVDAKVRLSHAFGGVADFAEMSERYDRALTGFDKVVEGIRTVSGMSEKEVVDKMYGYYARGKYEKVFEMFNDYLSTLDEITADMAFEDFEAAFPELKVNRRGRFDDRHWASKVLDWGKKKVEAVEDVMGDKGFELRKEEEGDSLGQTKEPPVDESEVEGSGI